MVRAKKKQKRLDAIVDSPTFPPSPSSDALRRSSRVRRAPVVLDSSPVPSSRKKRPRIEDSSPATPNSRGSSNRRTKEVIVRKAISFDRTCRDSEGVNLRSRPRPNGEMKLMRRKKNKSKFSSNRKRTVNCPVEISPVVDRDDVSLDEEEGDRKNEKSLSDLNFLQEELNEDNSKEEVLEAKDTTESENRTSKDQIDDLKEDQDPIPTQQIEGNVAGEKSDEKIACEDENVSKVNKDATTQSDIKEERRCGLCGCGTDGRPPKILVHDLNAPHESSDKEAYEGLSGSEETNYDVWDGFGDEPGWLGRLLGPIRDQFGITRIWVHQNCAVWSPEVYFAGPGYLKSVRAALYRGKALKCSRCGRPGATIGCRVDRCPKTYHLPCSRADGCIFDHRKFLIACNYHRHLFEPRGDELALHLRKLKRKKLWADLKKCSDEARRKDIDAEEKWLENCGEDEEFLRRESKRLQRDLLRIAPTFIGGSSNSNQSSEGWESIAGLQDVIRCMKEVVILPLLYPEVFHSLSLTPPRGVLLHGHPGTGKTLVVRALIGACSRSDKKIAYFARKGADCLGKYVGDAERQLRLLFQVAEKSQPSIIFFDEIDGLAPCRSRRQDQTHNSVVATLLSLMDGLKSRGSVVVIGATNRPDAVDPALRRPGRFDREIYFPLPTCEERSAILSLHTKKWPSPMSGSFLSFVANQTVGYAGADLRSVCTQAAINALKRQCPLSDILSLAEKGLFGQSSGPPALPQISVDEKDWLLALASAPPPCSRREAGAAANEVITSPLESHLVPCLLKPLCQLLVWLSLDERVWLPSSLLKMSTMVKGFIFSDMERNNFPTALWLTHIYSLIEKRDVANELVKVLTMNGIITGSMGVDLGIPSGDVNSNKIDMSGTERSASDLKNSFMYSKSTGFRVVIGGPQRSGQQRLASCLLHAFLGQIDIHKVNLATMSQEGNGDIISGLTQILMRCLNNGRCIIYMPRMDLWAIEIAQKEGSTDDNGSSKASELARVSEVWSTFVEQVDSARTSMSTIILATSEIQLHDLPVGIMQFFNAGEACQSNAHTIPRFSVNLDGTLNHSEVINSFSARLSYDLAMHYIQLAHQSAHTAELENPLLFQLPSKTEMETKINKVSSAPSEEVPSTVLKKPAKSNIMTGAIWSFGYQILRNPQFSELCWVTSKLREGPSTNTNGPWKGWPFNSCVVRNNSAAGVAKEKQKDQDDMVRGLVAVGLMAYRGVYNTPYDLCCDVRKVLELLAQKIRVRVSRRRGPYRYFRVLTQAAYLDDMVLNWAYSFQRSYGDIKIPSSCPTPVGEKPCNDNCASQDEACGKALEGDVVQITNEVAKECSIPTATEDRMEIDPRVNEPVSDRIDKLLTDPSVEKQTLSPPIDEPASSETLEQHSLTEGILKESQNPIPENGVAEPTTLTECSPPTATEERIEVDPQVDKLVSDSSDELVTNPSIEKQPLSPSINEPASSKTQEQYSLTAGISESQNHPESEVAELTILTECSIPTVTEERMEKDSRVDEPVSGSIDEQATDPRIEKQPSSPPINEPVSGSIDEQATDPRIEKLPLSPPINEPASSKTQGQHSFADTILKESQNQIPENGVAELTTLTECSIPTATEDRMEVDPRVEKPVSGPIDELATDPSIGKQSVTLPIEETISSKTQDEHTLTEADSKSENPIPENRDTELTTLTETQEQDKVTESLTKDSPMLTCEGEDTEPVIVENQDPSTSAEFFESVSVLRKKDSCIYICCSKCFHEVHAAVDEAVLKFWTSHDNCSTIEDMHDILSSYGLHLVSTLSKRHASEGRSQGDAVHPNSCQCHKMVSGNVTAPQECECHMSNGKEGEDITLRFLFRDGVLMPMNLCANVDGTETLHCSLKRLCMCPVLDRVGFL